MASRVRGERNAQMYQQPQPLPKNLCTARLYASLRAASSRSPQATKSRGAERRVSSEARRIASRVRGERNAHIFAQCPPPPPKKRTSRLCSSPAPPLLEARDLLPRLLQFSCLLAISNARVASYLQRQPEEEICVSRRRYVCPRLDFCTLAGARAWSGAHLPVQSAVITIR